MQAQMSSSFTLITGSSALESAIAFSSMSSWRIQHPLIGSSGNTTERWFISVQYRNCSTVSCGNSTHRFFFNSETLAVISAKTTCAIRESFQFSQGGMNSTFNSTLKVRYLLENNVPVGNHQPTIKACSQLRTHYQLRTTLPELPERMASNPV